MCSPIQHINKCIVRSKLPVSLIVSFVLVQVGFCYSGNYGLLLCVWVWIAAVLLNSTLLVTPNYKSCCVVRSPRACGMDCLLSSINCRHYIKHARYCWDCKTLVHWSKRLRCTRYSLHPGEKVDPPDCHCIIRTLSIGLTFLIFWHLQMNWLINHRHCRTEMCEAAVKQGKMCLYNLRKTYGISAAFS